MSEYKNPFEEALKKDTEYKNPFEQYVNYDRAQYAQTLATKIENRVNKWLKNNNTFIDNAKYRAQNRNGYVSDSGEWLSTITTQKSNFDREKESILNLVNEYKDVFDPKWVQSISSVFDANGKTQADIVTGFTEENSYWSQWENEDVYNDWVAYTKEQERLFNLDVDATAKQADTYGSAAREVEQIEERSSRLAAEIEKRKQALSKSENARDRAALKHMEAAWEEYELQKKAIGEKYGIVGDFNSQSLKEQEAKLRGDASYAEYKQKGKTLKDEALKASDFETNNKYGAETWGVLFGEKDYIKNWLGQVAGKSIDFYDAMTEEEKKILGYYLAHNTEHSTKLKPDEEVYLYSIEEEVNGRLKYGIVEDKDTAFEKILFSFEAGLDQFGSGIGGAIDAVLGEEGYKPPSATQMASGEIRQEIADGEGFWNGVLGVTYDLGSTTANMLPSILIGMANPVAGATLMGVSAGGNAYTEMINLGYSKGQAIGYGTLVGASEALLERFLGGISALGGKGGTALTAKLLSKVDNAFARVAIQTGGSMISEFTEESLQTILEPWFKSLTTGVDYDAPNIDEVLYSGLLGALSAGILEGGGNVISAGKTTYQGHKLKKNGDVDALTSYAETLPDGTDAKELASKVKTKDTAYTVGRLFNSLGEGLTSQNHQAIHDYLTSKGVQYEHASMIGDVIAKSINGEALSARESMVLRFNPLVKEALNTVKQDGNYSVDIDPETGEYIIKPSKLQQTLNANNTAYDDVHASLKALAKKTAGVTEDTESAQKDTDGTKASEDTQVVAESENATESIVEADAEASESVAEIKNIASIENGKVTYNLEDGTTSSEATTSNKIEGLVYESVTEMDATVDTANSILDKVRTDAATMGEQDLRARFFGIKEVYWYGRHGISADEISRHGFADTLTEAERAWAYDLGKKDRAEQTAKKEAAAKSKQKPTARQGENEVLNKDGLYYDKRIKKSSLNSMQRASVDVAKQIHKILGVDVHLFASYVKNGTRYYRDANGVERKAPNGMYINGNIYLDINAGQKGEGIMLNTLAHELTHHIEEWSPEKYKKLCDFLMEQYAEKGISVSDLVYREIAKAKKNGRDVSFDEAYNDVIANSMEKMLHDGTVLNKLAQTDIELFNKVKAFVDKIVARIKEIYANVDAESLAGKYVARMNDSFTEIQNLFADALMDAGENYKAATESELVEEHTAGKDEAQFSERDSEDELSQLREEYSETRKLERDAKKKLDSFGEYSQYDELTSAIADKNTPKEKVNELLADYKKWQDESGYTKAYEEHKALQEKARKQQNEIQRMEERLSKELREKKYSDEEIAKFVQKAVRKFHTTQRLDKAAYLLTTGSMLDFSDGQGYRVKDHREISEILDLPDYAQYADGMITFMNMGNIRLQTYGIDISAMPNSKQIASLRGIIPSVMREYDEFTVDFSKSNGNTDGSVTYPKGVSSARIISDIKGYFETGVVPEYNDSLSQFRYSEREDVDKYTEKEYNNFGWARADEVLSARENADLRSKFAAAVSKQAKPPKTKAGEYMISIGDTVENKVAVMKGTIDDPIITRIVEIDEYDETKLAEIRSNLYALEGQGIRQETRGIFVRHTSSDFGMYEQSERSVGSKPRHNDRLGTKRGRSSKKIKGVTGGRVNEDGIYTLVYSDGTEEATGYKFSERDSEGNTLSEGQQQFFKNSKIRDKDGNLMAVYHGTPNKFTTFRQGVAEGWGKGIYFTDNEKEAKNYGDNIVKAYLNITNPFNADTMSYDKIGAENTKAYRDFDMKKWKTWWSFEYDTYEEYVDDGQSVDMYEIYTEEVEVFNKILRELGYDGIVAHGSNNIDGYEIVAFDESQPKLTTNTTPTSDPDIRYSERDYEGTKVDKNGKPRSAQAQRDAGYMLNETKFNQLYSAHKIDIGKRWGDVHAQIESIKAEGFKGGSGAINTLPVGISNIRMYNGEPIFDDIIQKAYAPKKGEYILLVPKNWVNKNGKVIEGFKPLDYEVVQAERDYQPYYELYEKAYKEREGQVKYSERDPDYAEELEKLNKALEKENAKLKEDKQNLKELLALQKKVTNGKRFTQTSVIAAAKNLMKYANAKGEAVELARLLNTYYEGIARSENLDWDDVTEAAAPAAKWLKDHTVVRYEVDETAMEVRRYLKSQRVNLTEEQKAEAEHAFNGYNNFRKKAMGYVTISEDAVQNLEKLWLDLSENYPYYFDSNVKPADMPKKLIEVMSSISDEAFAREAEYEYEASEAMIMQDLVREVYNGYWDVSTLHTVADKAQKEIMLLKAKHNRQMGEAKEHLKETVAKLKQDKKEQVAKVRKQYQGIVKSHEDKLIAKHQEQRERAKESRTKTEMRHKIKKVVNDLNRLLLTGNKESHVKLGLQPAVAAALEAINFDTVAAEQRLNGYTDEDGKYHKGILQKIAETTDEDVKAGLEKTRDFIQTQGDAMNERLDALRKAYSNIQNQKGDFPDYYRAEAKMIEDRINVVIEQVGNTPLRFMTLDQLTAVHDLYTIVLTTVRNANNVFKQGKTESLQANAASVMTEIQNVKKLKEERSALGEKLRGFVWNEHTPFYAFSRVGSKTLSSFFWELVRGQNVYAQDIEEARAFASTTRQKYGYEKWDTRKVHEFKLEDGRTFRVSLAQIMSIYAYSKRKQALDHMSIGGFFFNDKFTFRKKGKLLEQIKSNEEGYCINENILNSIKSAMTEEQIKYVDEMQAYLTEMGKKGNEVTRVMWGIDIFKEAVYFPLRSVKDFIYQANQPAQESSLKNDGMTKETKPHASNPIVLENFDDVWSSHVERMSQYHGFVVPIDNINKVLNYGTWANTASVSISTMLSARYGSAVNEYLTQFVKDLNGSVSSQGASNPIIGMVGKFKKTAVAASASVVIQQPTAVLRALSEVDAKYFVGKPRMSKETYEQLKKYAPIAIIKEIGGFDAGSGRQAKDWLNADTYKGIDKVMRTIDDASMWAAGKADAIGWLTIWDAVKRECVTKYTNLAPNSEEFLQKAGERFTEVIVKTQVYDSTLSRSGYMRSKSDTVKMATSFMGEPTLSINGMADAVIQLSRGTIPKGKAIRTIAATYASMIAASAAASLIYAMRDDDDDEAFVEKYLEAFGDKLISDINPLSMLPFVKDIMSVFEGWEVERTDMAIIQDIYNAWESLDSDTKSPYRKVEDFAGAIAAAFGVPVKNVMRTGREIYNFVEDIFDKNTGGDLWGAFVDGITGEDKKTPKTTSLYEAILNGDDEKVEKLKSEYKDEASYESAVKKALRENDERIKEAAEAYNEGDIRERDRILAEIVAEGYFDEELVAAAIKAEANALNNDSEEDAEPEEEKATSIYKADDINVALESGDKELALEIIDDLVKTKVANGMEEDKARSSVKSSVTSHWKALYKAAYQNKDAEEMKRIRYILLDTGLYGRPSEVVETCRGWIKELAKEKNK